MLEAARTYQIFFKSLQRSTSERSRSALMPPVQPPPPSVTPPKLAARRQPAEMHLAQMNLARQKQQVYKQHTCSDATHRSKTDQDANSFIQTAASLASRGSGGCICYFKFFFRESIMSRSLTNHSLCLSLSLSLCLSLSLSLSRTTQKNYTKACQHAK